MLMTNADSDSPTPNGDSKVERIAVRYEIDGIGAELEERWTTDGNESSTRQLAKYFNESVVRAALRGAGATPLESEVKTIYEALSTNGTDTTELIEVRERLSEHGINAESLADDFVSHQTIYRYLTEVRGAERASPSEADRLRNASEPIQRLQGRTTAVTEQTVDSLSTNDAVSIGSFDVLTDVQVFCRDCGRSYNITAFLERGHCDCTGADGAADSAE